MTSCTLIDDLILLSLHRHIGKSTTPYTTAHIICISNANTKTPCYRYSEKNSKIPNTPCTCTVPPSLRKIPQLGQLIQQLLQIPVRDLMLQARNQRFRLLRIITAQTACTTRQQWPSTAKRPPTQLRPLKHLQLRVRVQQPLHGLDVLLVLEPRKHLQVVERFGEVPVREMTM